MNVILTGLRGTGKSSIGKVLAHQFTYAFVDTDTRIEELAQKRIAEIVARDGWDHFRALERQVVTQVAAADRQVVAAGGGTLIDVANAELLKKRGVVVLLLCELPILQRRIAQSNNRPSLTGQGAADVELVQVWEARRARYHAVADVIFDVSAESINCLDDVECKATAIATLVRQWPHFTMD
jgi:shikimate kinase